MQVCYLNTLYKTTSGMIETINPGDLCIVQDNGSLYFVIANEDFKEKYFSGYIQNIFSFLYDKVLFTSDCILFKFDGITRREGNLPLISTLLNLSLCNELHTFFEDVFEILLYKEHKLNVQTLLRLYSKPFSLVHMECHPQTISSFEDDMSDLPDLVIQSRHDQLEEKSNQKPVVKPINIAVPKNYEPSLYIFYDYLLDEYKALWNNLFQEGKNTGECLTEIKKRNKNHFNSVLRKFKITHPDDNIYSLKNDRLCHD